MIPSVANSGDKGESQIPFKLIEASDQIGSIPLERRKEFLQKVRSAWRV